MTSFATDFSKAMLQPSTNFLQSRSFSDSKIEYEFAPWSECKSILFFLLFYFYKIFHDCNSNKQNINIHISEANKSFQQNTNRLSHETETFIIRDIKTRTPHHSSASSPWCCCSILLEVASPCCSDFAASTPLFLYESR